MEIERKFLINNIDNLDLTKYKKKSIIQDYLYFDRLSCIRKRKIESNNEIKYTYTIKTDKTGISVNEIEKEIDEKLNELNATVVDAAKKAEELGNLKVMNVILLGSLVRSMNLEHINWEYIIRKNVKEKFIDLNIKAFEEGLKLVGHKIDATA